MAKVDWDQENYDKSSGFEVLPKGRYLAIISDSEDKQTKKKDGRYFEFEFVIASPKQYANRKLWARFNVHNPSETAQRIGREQFNALADCCGMMGKVQKTEQLHDRHVVLLVGVRLDDRDKEQNEILGFQKHEGPAPTAKPASAAAKKPEERKPAEAPAKKPASKFDEMDDDIPF